MATEHLDLGTKVKARLSGAFKHVHLLLNYTERCMEGVDQQRLFSDPALPRLLYHRRIAVTCVSTYMEPGMAVFGYPSLNDLGGRREESATQPRVINTVLTFHDSFTVSSYH